MQLTYFKLVFLLIALSFSALAQENLPKGLTEAEEKVYDEYIRTFEYGGKGIQPPAVAPRTPAEFEEMGGVIVTWTSYTYELRELVRHARLRVPVYIISNNPSGVQSYLTQGGVPMDNIYIMQLPFNSVWVRDYGPQSIYLNGTDELAFVDWLYNRPYRPDDNMLPTNLGNALDIEVFQMTTNPNRLVTTGGNFMSDGQGTGFSSKLVLTENSSLTESQIDAIKYAYMGIDRYIKMDELPYDNISHLDMHMKLLDEETLLVGQFPQGVSDGPYIETNLSWLLNNHQTCYERDYQVVRIPMVPSSGGNYPPNTSYRTFTNSLILNDLVLVPQYYNSAMNSEAISVYQQAMPGYDIVGVDMESVIPASGAIHCITREIAATDPIFIAHAPIRDAENDDADHLIEAVIRNASGINSASVFYAVGEPQNFTELPMTLAEGKYIATIPAQQCSTTVYYYISATNANEKTITKPLVTPANAWSFTSGTTNINFSASSNTAAINEEVIFSYTGCLDPEDISEVVWIFGEGAVPATATGIEEQHVYYTTDGYKDITLTINGEELKKDNLVLVTPLITYTLNVQVQGEGQTNPTTGNHVYVEGTEVSLSVEPTDGWEFEKWTISPGDTETDQETIALLMTHDITATAVFKQTDTYIPQWSERFYFELYPNPASGHFNIVMSPSRGAIAIRIFNSQGQLVFSDTTESIHWDEVFQVHLPAQSKGVFFVQISGSHGSITKRIILQ